MFRDALPSDRIEFLTLWAEYLKELESYGGEYTPDNETMRDIGQLFDAYTQGSRFGCCVLYEPPGEGIQGAAFCGEGWGTGAVQAKKWGKTAWGWGVYLRPEHRRGRVAYHLQINTGRKLKALGFDTLVGDILLENETSLKATQAAGWVPHSVVHVCNLGEWEHG